MAITRRPPPVVPTLTDVIGRDVPPIHPSAGTSEPPPIPLAPQPSASALAGSGPVRWSEAEIDALVDRVLARLMPDLEWRVADALQAWMSAQAASAAVSIADALRDPIAECVRQVCDETSGTTRN